MREVDWQVDDGLDGDVLRLDRGGPSAVAFPATFTSLNPYSKFQSPFFAEYQYP